MNQVTREQKDRVMKTLAILGFIAVIIFGVWLAVQVVGLVPQAFNSLASIADSIYNYQEPTELTVTTDQSTVNAGEAFLVTWEDVALPGVYTFSYACTEGVSLDVRDNSGAVTQLDCGESITIAGDVTELEVTAASERQRFTDLSYTIAFIPEGESEPLFSSENMVTIVNASIPEGDVAGDDDAEEDEEEAGEPVEEDDGVAEEPDTSAPAPTPQQPQAVEEVVYETPVSDPTGQTDLTVELVAIGELDESGNFTPRARLLSDSRAAFQFSVTNIGTKTSNEWDFQATLTNGTEYDAKLQAPLRPQESVLFTLGYDNVGEAGIRGISVTVRGGDTNPTNNSFSWAVSVVE